MHLPEGKNGIEINSKEMLLEPEPIIGTGEWENLQCDNFKTIANGSIILVRKGNEAIALCKIISDNFTDNALSEKAGISPKIWFFVSLTPPKRAAFLCLKVKKKNLKKTA